MNIEDLAHPSWEERGWVRTKVTVHLFASGETVTECNGHRHKDGKRCIVIVPVSLQELAEVIESGSYPKENL